MGYVEGRNLLLQRRSAEGRGPERAAEIDRELIREGVDVIVVASTLDAKELMRVTNTIPIVMVASTDPLAMGVVSSLGRPGGNVTGFTMEAAPEIDGKRLLKEAAPYISRLAFLGLKSDWDHPNGEAIRVAAQSLGMRVELAEHTRTNYADALASIERDRVDALFVAIQPASFAKRQLIINFALQHRLPCTYPWREFVDDGGFMSYGASLMELFRRSAGYTDKILKGTKPDDLPVEQPTKFELVINLKTAMALGLTVPPSLLARADEVIE